ncbi:MAG: 16S rRNA (adenine(1518)-N(6)/adenine(1519)-N(6))-dimethyltransferase RsmA [Holosporaceae bacterium]|nr:16S rRNA (adenine(1518)-N(6)/adenine(1519)-N(6))-dimethyltransferase RsmA [Holosporaceae bacterium]
MILCDAEKLSAKKIFDSFFHEANKKFGQNFLFDEKINRKIVSVAGDLTGKVIAEVGPGPGGLTLEILKHNIKKIYVIEIDKHWSGVWKSLSQRFDGKLEIIEQDALNFDFQSIAPDMIISNLPYNISTQLLFKWLREFDLYESMVLMFQKEVADRLYAIPSTKSYGKLSVLTQWKSRVAKAFDVEPGSFFPAPRIRSTVVKFIPYKKKFTSDDFLFFSNLLASVFMHRRKVVVKTLANFFPHPEELLLNLGYHRNTRAEEITVDDYMKIMASSFRIYLDNQHS